MTVGTIVLPLFLLAALAVQAEAAKPLTFYVATSGNDSWSGKLSAPNKIRSDGPFLTVARARDAVRQERERTKGLRTPVTVFIRGGEYFLGETLVLTPDDSGTKECPITYAAYRAEKALLSGGQVIHGWHEEQANGRKMWTASIPDVKEGKWWFRQLFVNGERRPRTRLPKEGLYRIAELIGVAPDSSWGVGQTKFRFSEGDIKVWRNLEDVEVIALHYWVESRMPIASVDEKSRTVTLSKKSVFRLTEDWQGRPAPYYVENVFEALDTPGQWYLDRKAGKIYYLPKPGEEIENCRFVAPRLVNLIKFDGDEKRKLYVEHVRLRGLSFAHTEWNLPADSAGFGQAAWGVPGAILLRHARNCEIGGCSIAHVGTYAVEFGDGCDTNAVRRSVMLDMGAGGVKVGHHTERTIIADSEIADGGKIFHSAVGVWIGNSGHNRVLHNHIHDFYYTGVSVGWSWGYGATKTVANEVAGNHIHHVGRGWLSDLGGIYHLGVAPGTVLRRNLIHDCESATYGGWGIYLDEGSTHVRVQDNLVYRTKSGGFHQHYGKQNIVQNNIFAFAKEHQIQRSRPETHLQFTFRRNIVYWDEGALLGGNWSGDVSYKLDYNLYWQADGKPFDFAGQTLEQWQEKGLDVHSIIADPGFADPKKLDFRLKPDSPAFSIGFRQFDLSDVGPRK